jgi:hypothetical protein
MGNHLRNRDTMPCPPPDDCGPESGQHFSIPRSARSSHPAPRFTTSVEEELRERLDGIYCPHHDEPARAELSIDEHGAVQIVPMGCCDELDRLILATLRRSVTLAPPAFPD